jgi:hypothetical protein
MQRLGEQTATTPVILCSYHLKGQLIARQQETQKKKSPDAMHRSLQIDILVKRSKLNRMDEPKLIE